jgi:hypothetical protein
MIFKDISDFNNVNDYLPILNGCMNTDLLFMFMLFHGIINSVFLKKWYKRFNICAFMADVLIIFIGIIITRFLYKFIFTKFNIIYFTCLAVMIQITHDFIFYLFFSNTPNGYNYMLDFFKSYAKELGVKAILGDSLMMITACLLSSYSATYSSNLNIISLIITLYFTPYMIYYEG